MQILTKQQVEKGMQLLNAEQRDFILQTFNQSKKSKWLEVLARNKGISITKDTPIDELARELDWALIEIKDSGFGRRDYRCMCGTPLRYQYIVLNNKNGEQIALGKDCFQNHTNLPAGVVKDIVNEFHTIDLWRDEIITKVLTGYYFDVSPYLHIENIPLLIREQAQIGLPLTDKQVTLLKQLKYEHDLIIRRENIISSLKPEAKEYLEMLSYKKKKEILEKLEDKDFYRHLPNGFKDDEIEKFMYLGLPLVDEQRERIFSYNRNIKRKQEEEKKAAEAEYWRSVRAQLPKTQSMHSDITINYETLIDRHMETLVKVTEREHELSPGIKKDWERVQDLFNQCRDGQDIDYSSFKINLINICNSLRLRNEPNL